MSGDLPPIPDEAWNAAQDTMHGQVGYDVIRPIVEAVAPFIYAAALREAERLALNASPAATSQMTFVGGRRRAWALINKRRRQVLGLIP